MRTLMRACKMAIVVLAVPVATLGLLSLTAHAGIAGFKAGRIIDDVIFTNSATMSVQDIQAFLNSKIPVCDTWGTQMYNSWQTRAQFAATIGQYPPFTCLKDYSENNRSAARIIYDTARTYQINPQVLIVLLQKEQGLVTDSWPYASQYRTATGYGCPDTAACNTAYYGFTNQLTKAANMFHQIIIAAPSWYTPYVLGNNYILYNPNRSCGGSTVNIENRATQALYNYTPYQPNQATLDAGWGTALCGAYGNRNFYLYFTTWFGPTSGTAFFQLPDRSKTYIYGANNTYYFVPSYGRLLDYGFGSKFNYRIDNLTYDAAATMNYAGELPSIARFEGDGIFIINEGSTHPFTSIETFNNYGYSFGNEASLPYWMQQKLDQGDAVSRIVIPKNVPVVYYIENGKKRTLCNDASYSQLGSPTYSSLPVTTMSNDYVSTIPIGSPIASEGDVIVSDDSTRYGLWQNNLYVPIDPLVASQLGAENCRVSQSAIDQMPTKRASIKSTVQGANGSRYLLDRYTKLPLTTDSIQMLGLDTNNFTTVSSSFLQRIPLGQPIGSLVRGFGSDSVYLLDNGKSYHIPSPDDLFGLGFNFNQVQSITSVNLSLMPSGGTVYKPGRIVRVGSQDGVFLLDANYRRYAFISPSDIFRYGYTWSDVVSISQQSLEAYQPSGAVTPYARDSEGGSWLISKSIRYKLSDTLSQSNTYDVTSLNSILLSRRLLGSLTEKIATKVFRIDNSDAVFMIENGKKRVFTNSQTFLSMGFKWSDVMSLDRNYVDNLPNGPLIL